MHHAVFIIMLLSVLGMIGAVIVINLDDKKSKVMTSEDESKYDLLDLSARNLTRPLRTL